MPIGYLTTVILMALCTFFALAPPQPSHSSPSNLSFWFGYLLNELPFLAFWWLLASTLLAFGQDTIVIVDDARNFVEKLQAASSNPVVYAELPGAQHSFDLFHSLRFDTVIDGIESFSGWVRTRGEALSRLKSNIN